MIHQIWFYLNIHLIVWHTNFWTHPNCVLLLVKLCMYNIVSPHFLHYSPLSSHSNGHKSSPIWILPAEVPLLNAYIILSPYFDELFWMVKSLYFKGLINDVGFPSLVKFPPKVVFFSPGGVLQRGRHGWRSSRRAFRCRGHLSPRGSLGSRQHGLYEVMVIHDWIWE